MRLLIVNPNTTAAMTEKIRATARQVAAPGTEIIAVNPAHGPVSIEGHYDEVFCLPGLIEEARRGVDEGADAVIVACFDDPGLDACREVLPVPVLGICQAAMQTAAMLAHGFSVVTTLSRSVPTIERLALIYGMDRLCRRVRAAEVAVLALEEEPEAAAAKVAAEVHAALREDGSDAVLLGCAGMTDLASALSAETGAPVIDGVAAAVKLAEAVVGLGLTTAKAGAYAMPRAKRYAGVYAGFAPAPARGG